MAAELKILRRARLQLQLCAVATAVWKVDGRRAQNFSARAITATSMRGCERASQKIARPGVARASPSPERAIPVRAVKAPCMVARGGGGWAIKRANCFRRSLGGVS